MNKSEHDPDRRDFLTGKSIQQSVRAVGDQIADTLIGNTSRPAPDAGDILRLTARAMACDFAVMMNAGEHRAIWEASKCLDSLEQLEQQMSVYRADSEISRLNETAFASPVKIDEGLFQLLHSASKLSVETNGAFDLTSDPLIRLWRTCRDEMRVPDPSELQERLEQVGMQFVRLDKSAGTVKFDRQGLSLNLGAIGKGHALDCMTRKLVEQGSSDFLLHGGRSSVIAQGENCQGGWPVGIGNPLFTDRRLGTIVLKNQSLATSGSNIQHFRIGDQRYGHILDPRTGWPTEQVLSVTVVAPTAAAADALSTAFYVMGIEETQEYCDNHPDCGAIVIPKPSNDRRVRPHVFGVEPGQIYWDAEQIVVPD